jgi:hypothetical protein
LCEGSKDIPRQRDWNYELRARAEFITQF